MDGGGGCAQLSMAPSVCNSSLIRSLMDIGFDSIQMIRRQRMIIGMTAARYSGMCKMCGPAAIEIKEINKLVAAS